ncbi:putative MFS-type transporter C16A3,17c [Schizosaccharomyces pombe 972h-] [Rhizoctonia solani]|uniref:Putative MFS-type transporter C16A3,17c [Schizosaccharomyces pombe 972h-] n=1 Tax=Rhizoctonia solani TaxID=456999 RepID=A0A0K6G255_9AGAM|nr:putative MFS-type transporter C16A3,17c [Schizosaccharomyces pombe 972h-] [Rhizoctonia solani]
MTISVPCSPSSASTFSESCSRASTPTLVHSQLAPDDKFDDGRSMTESMISSLASDMTDVERNSIYASSDELGFERLLVIHASLAVCLFLAITDTTIVSTSLPTINAELGGTSAQYSWVGVSYMLTQTIFQPLYGQFTMMFGRKRVLYTCMIMFLSTSWLCGAAQSTRWLVIARALQGVGGGGIVTLVWVILEEVAPAKSRQRWNTALMASNDVMVPSTCANDSRFRATDLMSWRWAFYVNLPVGCAALIAAMLSLSAWQEAPCSRPSITYLLAHFDWVGLILLVGGTAALVIGFSLATIAGWTSTLTLVLVSTGVISLALGAVYESGVFGATRCWGFSLGANPKHALFAPMLLRTRTAGIILVFSFFQTMSFNAGTFYLALYYQAVQGSSAIHAGMQLLPYTLGSSLVSLVGFYISDRTKAHITMIRAGLGLMATGFGLMIFLDERSGIMVQTLIPLVAGVGVGLLLKTPATALSLAMRGCDVPAVTAGLLLVRFIGTASGVSIGGAIYQNRLASNLPAEFSLDMSVPNFDYRLLTILQPESLRNNVLRAVSRSISSIWVVCALCLSIGFFLSLFLKQTPVDAASSSNDETRSPEESGLLQSQFDQKNYNSIGTCKKGGL